MPNNITTRLRYYSAQQFINNFVESSDQYLYAFVGRATPWDVVGGNPVRNIAADEHETNFSMIALKRVFASDMCAVVPRRNWRLQSIYDYYDDRDPALASRSYYVLNREYNVYVCLDNNRRALSTVEPTGTNLYTFRTADGYKWKYLYSITPRDQLQFLTNIWMPVRINGDVRATAVDGEIQVVRAIAQGSGYTYPNTTITISGDGEGILVQPVIVSNAITEYYVLNGGANYRYANIAIASTDGTGANARVQLPPPGGHGFDPVYELQARAVMINAKLEYGEGGEDFPVDISYRSIGLIRNPQRSTGVPVTSLTANVNTVLDLDPDAGADFSQNQYITGNLSLANAWVITSNVTASGNVTVRYIQRVGFTSNLRTFNVGELVTAQNTGSTGVVRRISTPEVGHYTGEILYIDNRPAVNRAPDQAENIHMVIQF